MGVAKVEGSVAAHTPSAKFMNDDVLEILGLNSVAQRKVKLRPTIMSNQGGLDSAEMT